MEVADHYRGQRESLSALALELTPDQLATPVPGCPLWTVQDVLAHLVGLCQDVLDGNLPDGGATPEWTGAQVAARRGRTAAELVEEWSRTGPLFEAGLADRGFRGWVFTYDVTMHGDDVREALGLPLGASTTHAVVLDGLIDRARSRADGVGTLTLRAGGRAWELGSGGPSAALTVDDEGELGRVIGARRSDDAVRALQWEGDPEPWLPVLPLFRPGR